MLKNPTPPHFRFTPTALSIRFEISICSTLSATKTTPKLIIYTEHSRKDFHSNIDIGQPTSNFRVTTVNAVGSRLDAASTSFS